MIRFLIVAISITAASYAYSQDNMSDDELRGAIITCHNKTTRKPAMTKEVAPKNDYCQGIEEEHQRRVARQKDTK